MRASKILLRLEELLKSRAPESKSLSNVIREAARNQKELMQEVVLRIKRAGLSLDIIHYSVLIKSFGDEGRIQEAEEVFEIMRKAGIERNIHHYQAMITAYAGAKQFEKVLLMLNKMRSTFDHVPLLELTLYHW